MLSLTNASNTIGGITTVSGGELQISADGDLGIPPATAKPGDLMLSGGVLATTGVFALNSNRGIALGPAAGLGAEGTIRVLSGTLNYGGVIADNGSAGRVGC